MAVLHDLVSRAKLFVEIVQIVPLAKDEMDNKYICQVKIELDPTRIDRILANTTITSSTSSTSCSNIANEIKVAVLGDFESGKSSLISVLSDWGSLDDSNGKMRTRLLHHRHELLSGTTSSLSIQSVGLKSGGAESIVLTDESLFLKLENRRELLVSEDVKIVHFVDTAGQVKFDHTVLSVLTCLPSPSVVFIVLKGPVDLKEAKISPQTREYFRLAKILKIRVCVIISKIDKSSTELIMLLIDRLVECVGGDYEFELDDGSASDSDSDPDSQNTSINMMACQEQCDTLTQKSSPLTSTSTEFKCKIFPCSAVSGEYLDQINFFLYKSVSSSYFLLDSSLLTSLKSIFIIEQIVKAVEIDGKDCFVLFGRVGHGRIGVNDTFSIGPHHINKATGNYSTPVRIASLQRLKFPIKVAKEGEHVTIAIEPLQALCSEINRGMVLFRCDDQIYANNYLQLKPIKRIIAGIGRININKNTAVESPATRTTYKGSIFINGQRFSHCTLDIEPTSRSLRRLRAAHPHSERICLISFAESNPASVFIQPGAPIIFIENCTKNRDKFAGIIIDYFS